MNFHIVRRSAKSALLLSALILAGCDDSGVDSDNNFERGPWVYADSGPGDITLNIAQSVWVDEKEPGTIKHSDIVLTTKIPRNLVSICFPYSRGDIRGPLNVNRLPDEVFCNKAGIDINYITGIAMTESKELRYGDQLRELEKQPQPSDPAFGKLPEDRSKVHDIRRYYEISADITFKSQQSGIAALMRNPKFRQPDSEGLEVYYDASAAWSAYFNASGKDGIDEVLCTTPDDFTKQHPEIYCTYNFPLNGQLQTEVKFIDFRLHGGRLFAEERVAAFKKWACPIFQCSEQALAEAKVRGGF